MRLSCKEFKKLLKKGDIVQELTLEGDIICKYMGKQYTASYVEDYIKLKKIKPLEDTLTLIYDSYDERERSNS